MVLGLVSLLGDRHVPVAKDCLARQSVGTCVKADQVLKVAMVNRDLVFVVQQATWLLLGQNFVHLCHRSVVVGVSNDLLHLVLVALLTEF